MNKFTKISATALFALFLTACDKPAEKAPEAAPAQTEQAAPAAPAAAEAPKAEQAAPAADVKPLSAEEKADYDKVIEWNKSQEKVQQEAQAKLQATLEAAAAEKDSKKIAEAIEGFDKNIKETIKNLDALDIKTDLVKQLKEKTKAVLGQSSDVLLEQVKLATAGEQPAEEAVKAYQEKVGTLQNALTELQKLSVELETRANATK